MRLEFDHKSKDKIVYRGHVIVSSESSGYVRTLVQALGSLGIRSVLEVGYGLGISARAIQEMLRPDRHTIIEMEDTVYADACRFCQGRMGCVAVNDDFYGHKNAEEYDCVFYDPCDYGNDGSYEDRMATCCAPALREGGILCRMCFGGAGMPDLPAFETVHCGQYLGRPFPLWDGSLCHEAQVGYYVKM